MNGASAELLSVTKRFGDVVALDAFDLTVAAGEFVAIVGPSGSGKTTATRILAGFERPDRGRVLIGERDVTAAPAKRRDVNTVFQNYALFPHLTVAGNVGYGLKVRGVKGARRRATVDELLALVRLEGLADRRPHQLSGGQQQRVAIARALARRPGVLLLDEPLGALDRKLRGDVRTELRRIHREFGTSFVYITHDQDGAFGLADRIVVVNAGRVEQQGSPDEIYDRPATLWAANFVGANTFVSGRVADRTSEAMIGSPASGSGGTTLVRPAISGRSRPARFDRRLRPRRAANRAARPRPPNTRLGRHRGRGPGRPFSRGCEASMRPVGPAPETTTWTDDTGRLRFIGSSPGSGPN
ncbi:ABC transporter ATP-binding protein [Kutzneria sp. CA-103260]|uniref:ABC transporter ATP-binding protein n=1 Tax=Kutzneria sp. CA-103260 TaxID=2802641 RepID=UPI001BA4C08C|nr:ABC transporter ATP-binding protein [Kutzneria sp. CA-103260]QUQ64527.1 Vitamin B12 import ATP-binding protein BtuD [Kutzneria sp. CA-103260]